MESRLPLASALVLCVVIGAPASSQPRATSVAPIPEVERFVQGTGLRVRLTVAKASVAALEDPGFVVHLDNVGKTPLRLNPRVAPNLYIYDEKGQAVVPLVSTFVNGPEIIITNARALPPGQTLSQPMRPEHHFGYDLGRIDSYTLRDRLLLRGGKYTARFVYINAPGFPANYEPRGIPGIWEGRLESEPVTFTVLPGAEVELSAFEQEYRAGVQEPRPRSVAEAEAALASNDREFTDATGLLVRLRSTSSMTALRRLLVDPEAYAWKRSAAAWAILMMDDERARDVAITLLDGPDVSLQAVARDWLTRRCTTSMLPLLEPRVAPLDGLETLLGKCGNAEAFLTLRSQLNSPYERIRRSAMYAIADLTFQGYEFSSRATPDEVDRWYESHKGESRRMWAERLIRENQPSAGAAVDYLTRMNDPQVLPALRQATSSLYAGVRLIAARGIAQFNRAEGVALLKRELDNRHPWVCTQALRALNELTDHHYTFDFLIPAERQKATAAYAAVR